MRIDASGNPSRFATLSDVTFLSGITFDSVGTFGRRLLVTATRAGKTVLKAIDCDGNVSEIAKDAPIVEGGIAVAPPTFGPYAGKLIGPDERSGNIIAIARDGTSSVIARSGLPVGGDIGVESAGFVPLGWDGAAYLADRGSAGSPTAGTDTILRLRADTLRTAGIRDGDLVVATEAVGRTIAVRCTTACTVTKVAEASSKAHPEGRILFVGGTVASLPAPIGSTANRTRAIAIAGGMVAAVVAGLVSVRFATARRRAGVSAGSPSPLSPP